MESIHFLMREKQKGVLLRVPLISGVLFNAIAQGVRAGLAHVAVDVADRARLVRDGFSHRGQALGPSVFASH